MATTEGVIDYVSSVILQCTQTFDIAYLDINLTSLMYSSFQVGDLLNDILVTRQFSVEEETLSNLNELHRCLNQLCLEYERKIYVKASLPDTSSRGRPNKFIKISCHATISIIIVRETACPCRLNY